MDVPVAIRIASNFWWLLALLMLLVGACHLLLIFVFKLDKVGWKRSDYVWLGIAALGLIKLASDARVWWATTQLPVATSRTAFALKHLRSVIVDHPPTYLSTKFVRSEFSPPPAVFDETQRQYDTAWQWVQSLPSILPKEEGPPFKPLIFSETHPPEGITQGSVIEAIQWISRLFDEYESRRKEFEDLLTHVQKTEGEAMHLVLGPILLCLALAIRITKVTGEIRLERKPKPA